MYGGARTPAVLLRLTDRCSYNKYTNRFRLIKTENIWTYIELDTFTGRLWQVQFSVKDTEHMWFVPINLVVLPDSSETSSTYSVSPMTSIYQFYMVNNDTGAMYKFQWSQKGEDYRWIEPL